MTNLRISDSLSLPKDFATKVIAYLAKRNAGKTYCASVQTEEMLKAGIPIVVIDGMGIWWGLRVSKDGKGNGFPVVVFGGEHQDLPLVPEKAEQIARAIVQSNISCVLDLSELSKGQSRKVVEHFLDELRRINRVDRHVVIEEADMFAPQKTIGPEQAMCLSSVDAFVRRGGNRNLGCTLITQRSAVLNKDILTQSDCLVILRTLAPQDKKAIQLWVEEQTDQDKRKLGKWYDSLKSLENGEGYVWHPEEPAIFKKIKFRQRETFHATREFIKSPESTRIQLMGVGEFLEKFRKEFEPKPKEEPKPKSELQKKVEEDLSIFYARPQPVEPRTLKAAFGSDDKEKAQEVAKEIVKGRVPPPQEMNLEEKQLRINVSHSETVESLTTDTQKGQAIFVLMNDCAGQPTSISVILQLMREHGWNPPPKSFATMLGNWVDAGLVIKEGSTRDTTYRLPKFVKFDVYQK